jgi:ABC-type transport system involved in multi-copper enzyme maturation permease subunit
MAVYKRTYKAYRGPLTPSWSRFTVLARYGFANLFESRLFTAYTALCLIPFLVGLVFIYVINSTAVQALLGIRMGSALQVNNVWFLTFLNVEAWMSFILTAWGAPGMISKDFANHSIQLYLSRPLSRTEYLLGKISGMVALLSCTTWIPVMILFFVQGQLAGHGWLWENLWIARAIFVGGMLWILLICLMALALSVWVRWRIAATALMFAVFFVLPGFSFALIMVMRTRWGWLLNLPHTMTMVWGDLFHVPLGNLQPKVGRLGGIVPLWADWASLLVVCAFCLWLLNRKLKAREVERG